MIFGQLGNDTIQGDGSIDLGRTIGDAVSAHRATANGLLDRHNRRSKPPPTATTTSRATAATT